MAGVDASRSSREMYKSADAAETPQVKEQDLSRESSYGSQDLSRESSYGSTSDEESSLGLGLSVDSRAEEQIEKLKEFLSEASSRGDDVVTQNDANTVKELESLQGLELGTNFESGLGARLESAARVNLEIENQVASGYFPSETVYLEVHTLKEVLEESGATLPVQVPATTASPHSPTGLLSSDAKPTPTRNIDVESDLKNELDCLFQERASRNQGSA